MHSFISKVKNTLAEHDMVAPGDCVLVGVSGGPDSVALVHALSALKQELKIELVIAHLNHRARGAESDRDARFVKQLGETLKIRTLIEERDVPAENQVSKFSFQETARNIRLDFFERAMTATGARLVALGHTANDQVETVLINLLRGSGLKGLGGMSPVRAPYIRPLFDCSRPDVMKYLEACGISFCRDSSNDKTDYLRNRIRLELIPYLEEHYNPKIAENLFETSEILRADNDLLTEREVLEFERVVIPVADQDSIEIDSALFETLPLALRRRLIRRTIEEVKGNLRRISSLHIQEVLQLFRKRQSGKKIDLPGELEVVCLGERVAFKRILPLDSGISSSEPDSSAWVGLLSVPGVLEVGGTGMTLKAELMDPPESGFPPSNANEAFLDFDKTGATLQVRFFQAGDRLIPLGMSGSKKLKSLFIDEKVPREIRGKVPILTTGDNDIIWVYGTRIAHPYRVTPETRKVLIIKGFS